MALYWHYVGERACFSPSKMFLKPLTRPLTITTVPSLCKLLHQLWSGCISTIGFRKTETQQHEKPARKTLENKQFKRPSFIILSIASVVALSAFLMGINGLYDILHPAAGGDEEDGICSAGE